MPAFGGGFTTAYFADPYLRSVHFEGNSAPYGGAVSAYNSGRLDLGTSCLQANSADVDGGGIHAGVAQGNLLVRRTCFENNVAGGVGGAMWVPAGFAEVVNSSFLGNRASSGGAVATGYGGMVSVANSLFSANITTSGNGALFASAGATNTALVNHYNAFVGNTGGTYTNTYGNLSLVTLASPLTSCCPAGGSAAINAGSPDIHFNDIDGSRNDIGACGGPSVVF